MADLSFPLPIFEQRLKMYRKTLQYKQKREKDQDQIFLLCITVKKICTDKVCGARCRHYVQEGTFLLDVATLLPLDILYIWLGTGNQPIDILSNWLILKS